MRKEFGPIYSLSSTGKTKIWSALVVNNILYTTHGYIDGKKVTDQKEVTGVNIGKKNETSPFEQACNEAQSKYNKKIDKGYITNLNNVTTNIIELPMLANKYSEKSHTLNWPCFVSPKLDGVRLVTKNSSTTQYTSRTGKPYNTLNHLDTNIKVLLSNLGTCDGEAFNPDLSLQEISSAVKKENEDTKDIEYWLFDIINTTETFETRYHKIRKFFDKYSDGTNKFGFRTYGKIVEVPNYLVNTEIELESYHQKFVAQGFEGTMVRQILGLYILNHRSNNLLKRKDYFEDEFKIVSGHSGEGSEQDCIIFDCITKEGKTFTCRPKGSRKLRKEWLKNINELKNKMLTIRFQLWSKDKIPCQLRGICVRDYE